MENKSNKSFSVIKSILLTLPMFLILLVFTTHGNLVFSDFAEFVSWSISVVFFTTIFYLMLYKGKTDKYRAIVFCSAAILFCISFMSNLIDLRGSVTYTDNTIYSCETPFCHIVTTMVIIPAAIKQTIIFSGTLQGGFASISEMLIIVMIICIFLGRAFCSWGCFYGGWDDAASRIKTNPIIKKINYSFKYFSFAMLIIMALWSAESLMPQYCSWLCPFKAVTENEKIVDTVSLIKNIIFYSIFIILVIVLPFLTKKRIQCATFCPMGAFLSLFSKINLFEIRIDKEKCNNCGKCFRKCPLMAMKSDKTTSITCSKCGKCVDDCPQDAISYHIKGTNISASKKVARTLFIYLAYSFMTIFLAGSVINGLAVILRLFI